MSSSSVEMDDYDVGKPAFQSLISRLRHCHAAEAGPICATIEKHFRYSPFYTIDFEEAAAEKDVVALLSRLAATKADESAVASTLSLLHAAVFFKWDSHAEEFA